MLKNIRQITILNRIFNVSGSEWPKILYSLAIRLFYRIGFVIGWTLIVVVFISKYGVLSLPYLFVISALFTILASIIYSYLLSFVSKAKLMVFTIFAAGLLLFFSTYVFFINEKYFFFLLIFSSSFFLVQFKILLNSFTEELFTPLESERTFPLIESADTIGGIIAGLVIVILAEKIELYKFIYLWTASLFLVIPFLLMSISKFRRIKLLKKKRKTFDELKNKKLSFLSKLKREFKFSKRKSFFKTMFFIVFFQWLLFNLLEFQYTAAVYENVSSVVLEAGSGFEHSFIHDLGALFMFFNIFALVVQLFVAGRVINKLGVSGSIFLHPLVSFFGFITFLFSFNFTTAVLVKNNFTISSIIHTNAYHSTYYAIHEKAREYTRELLEGFVRPLGAVVGTMVILLLQLIFSPKLLVLSISLVMIFVAFLMMRASRCQQRCYTKAAIDDLVNSTDKKVRLNAIDILGQKGHDKKIIIPVLKSVLANEKEAVSIKVRILRTFGEITSVDTIDSIKECLSNSRSTIREAALSSLLNFKEIKNDSDKNLFLQYGLSQTLKDLYRKEKKFVIKFKILNLLTKLSKVGTIEFLFEILDSSYYKAKADAIYVLGTYKDEKIAEELKKFLNYDIPRIQMNAAISLARLDKYRKAMIKFINQFLKDDDVDRKKYAFYAVGELKLKKKKNICIEYLKSANSDLRIYSAIALAKMGFDESIHVIVDLLMCGDSKIAKKVRRLMNDVDPSIQKTVNKIIKHLVNNKIDSIVNDEDVESFSDLADNNLKNLRWWYHLAEEFEAVEIIDNMLELKV